MTANVTITKIQHRTGANNDLPQLDIGEFGFATDEQRLYIGNDPSLHPIPLPGDTTQTEILTEFSQIPLNNIIGSANSAMNITDPTEGQVLVFTNESNVNQVVNRGGMASGNIDLGAVENVKLAGGFYNYILETDGVGNLSWGTKGTFTANIIAISSASPAVMTLANTTPITNRAIVTISGVQGINTTLVNGQNFFVKVAGDFNTSGNLLLYTDSILTVPFNATGMVATPHTGRSVHSSYGKQVAGQNTWVQFNDDLLMGANSQFTYDYVTSTMSAPLIAGTLTTHAQPNITSVGTLVDLTVAGNSNLNNVFANNATVSGNVTSNIVTANIGNIANVNANIVTANIGNIANVNANIVTANIGNIANVNAISVIANTLTGKLTTPNQSNITTVGTLTGLTVNGDVAVIGNMTVSGNLQQMNVTSVTIVDPIIELGNGANNTGLTSNDGMDRGSLLHYFNGAPIDAFMGWDNTASEFSFGSNVTVANNVVTFNEFGNIRAKNFNGNVTGNLVGDVTGSLVGNVTGNVVGNLVGNVTGNVTGNLTGSLIGGNAHSLVFQSATNNTTFTSSPTSNTILKFNGSDYVWLDDPTVPITNELTSTTEQYPLFASNTSGDLQTVMTSDAKYSYKPSTGELRIKAPIATNGIVLNADLITDSFTIPTGMNGFSVGPMTLAPGATLTIAPGQRHVII